jgi:hypothetical protein
MDIRNTCEISTETGIQDSKNRLPWITPTITEEEMANALTGGLNSSNVDGPSSCGS